MLLAIPFPVIDPVALSLGPVDIRWYALSYVAGIALGWWYMLGIVSRPGLLPKNSIITREHVDDYLLWATLGIVLGGRIGYVLFYNLPYFLAHPGEILQVWQGGMSFHGGLLGIVLVTWWFARSRGLRILTLGDLVATAAPIGLFFGRIANFINGELYGRVTEVPWAMVFPGGGPLPRHPSQLYEALFEGLVLFVILYIAVHRFKALHRRGLVIGIFLTGYGLARFMVEFVRQYDQQLGEVIGFLTMGQLLSLPMMLIGLGFIVAACRKGKAAHAA